MSIFLFKGLIKTSIVTLPCRQILRQSFIGENRGFEKLITQFSLIPFSSYLDFLRWDNDNNSIFMFFHPVNCSPRHVPLARTEQKYKKE